MRRRNSASWLVVIVLAILAGCGSAATGPSGASAPHTLTKPTDAQAAVDDAIGRTASFTDVRYDQVNTTTAGTSRTGFAGTILATVNPPRAETRSTPTSGTGPTLDSIQDYSAGTFCSLGAEPPQRLTGQSTDPSQVSPFAELKDKVTGWTYLGDANGGRSWRATGKLARAVPGATLYGSAEADIDASTGKIVKTVTVVTAQRDALTFKTETVLSNFIYNSGIKVAAC